MPRILHNFQGKCNALIRLTLLLSFCVESTKYDVIMHESNEKIQLKPHVLKSLFLLTKLTQT